MKIAGKKVQSLNVEIIVLPRGNDDPLVFKAQAVLDDSVFDKFCPIPKPPMGIGKGGKKEPNLKDTGFLKACAERGEKKMAWMVIESLRATEELEWETVVYEDHTTWLNWSTEMKEAGLNYIEIQRIQSGVFAANCLNEAKIEAARNAFLHGPGEASESSSGLLTGPNSTPSGEPVNASE